jgi:monoamine oxidase
MERFDVVVLGAGAAGVAAARMLQAAGRSLIILEARSRIGGRIRTDRTLCPYATELGAEFVHGQNVPSWKVIRDHRLSTSQVFGADENFFLFAGGKLCSCAELSKHPEGRLLGFFSFSGLDAPKVIRELQHSGNDDADVATVFQEHHSDMTPDMRALIEGSYEGLNAASTPDLGGGGLLEATYQGDGDDDFRIDDGYDRWFELFAGDLPVRLGDPVTKVSWSAQGATIRTSSELEYKAQRLVITLPLALLHQGIPRFDPELPKPQQTALRLLGSGPITKVILRFRQPFWPAQMERLSLPFDTHFWWRPGWQREQEKPVLTCYVGGRSAQTLNAGGAKAAVETALESLRIVFGEDQKSNLADSRFVDWAADPWSRMGYSYVRPGGVGARVLLGLPSEKVLYWAGEATNPVRPATVHGAVESGERAAREILSAG